MCTWWTDDKDKLKSHSILPETSECPNCGAPIVVTNEDIFEILTTVTDSEIREHVKDLFEWCKERCFPDLYVAFNAMVVYKNVEARIRAEYN
jgi:glutaredoxin-related protein